jgi:hypothetical protein
MRGFQPFDLLGELLEVAVGGDLSADVDRVGQRPNPLNADLLILRIMTSSPA